MGIDSLDINDSGGERAGEAASEQSEKQREKSSKALAGIKRSQRDEAKGKKAADILFTFLIELLKHPQYDPFVEPIFRALEINIPSVYLVGVLALISHKASDTIRTSFWGEGCALLKAEPIAESVRTPFQNKTLRQDLRERINEWIEDMFLVATKDPSTILTHKFLALMEKKHSRENLTECFSVSISFFFDSKNIEISKEESRGFAVFILSELEKRVRSLKLEEV